MQRFVCKRCGFIIENPEIVPHPDKDSYYRKVEENLNNFWKKVKICGKFEPVNSSVIALLQKEGKK